MATLGQYSEPTAAQLARALLRAWVCGNKPLFRKMMAQDADRFSHERCSSDESERLELLKTVVGRMECHPAWSRRAMADPGIAWCVDMLEHLALTADRAFEQAKQQKQSGMPVALRNK
jgi:hypothetical protein